MIDEELISVVMFAAVLAMGAWIEISKVRAAGTASADAIAALPSDSCVGLAIRRQIHAGKIIYNRDLSEAKDACDDASARAIEQQQRQEILLRQANSLK